MDVDETGNLSQISAGVTENAQTRALVEPASSHERISAVDVLRGVAVLGILLINIEDFALLHSNKSAAGTEWVGVYFPSALGPRAVFAWTAFRACFEGKMRAIFSMLFGASIVLFTSRLERGGETARPADIYYRRTLWLVAFGILHAYLLWEGDILYSYAVSGLFLFPFRRLPTRKLILLGALALSISLPRAAVVALHRRDIRAQAMEGLADQAAGKTLTKIQESARDEWDEITADFEPDPETLRQARLDYLGGYAHLFLRRAELVRYVESSDFYGWTFFDSVGMMLMGMALIKAQVLTAGRSRRFYYTMSAVGYAVGLPVSAIGTYQLYLHRFDPIAVAWLTAAYDPGRIAVALGHIGLVMMIVKAKRAPWLTRLLGDVGRTALTNYIGATVICTTLFNGYGFGLFGSLRRRHLYLLVLGIWCFQVGFSRLWLRSFRFGPAEWLWRSLTYWKRQPLVRKTLVADEV